MTIVRVSNHSAHRFTGWKRTTVSEDVPGLKGPNWVTGKRVGRYLTTCDVHVDLGPGESCEILLDFNTATGAEPPPLTIEQIMSLKLPLSFHGYNCDLKSVEPDGAAWVAHFVKYDTDVWLRWYPGQGWVEGEIVTTRDGNKIIALGGWECAVDTGEGIEPQRYAGPLFFLLPGGDIMSFAALSSMHVCAVGHGAMLYPLGQPRHRPGFDPIDWMRRKIQPSLAAMSTLAIGATGIAPYSGQSGEQDDQLFVGGEALLPGGVGCELITYLGALKWANRPCHHRESDGSPLNPLVNTGRPRIFWDGQPHAALWHMVDRLGYEQPFPLNTPGSEGWYGPDVEHWLMNTLYAGARLTGSPALQRLLEAQAAVYLLQWTTPRGWSTSQPYASRAIGYECWNATLLFEALADRDLAFAVMNRWKVRYDNVLKPACSARWWEDGFKHASNSWAPWQQAWGAYGLWAAGSYFNEPEPMEQGVAAAIAVVEDGFYEEDGRWKVYKSRGRDGGPDDRNNTFYLFMSPCAAWLASRAGNARGRAIWQQMLADATTDRQFAMLPPGEP